VNRLAGRKFRDRERRIYIDHLVRRGRIRVSGQNEAKNEKADPLQRLLDFLSKEVVHRLRLTSELLCSESSSAQGMKSDSKLQAFDR